MTAETYPTAYVDLTVYGDAERFTAKVAYDLIGKVHEGDLVLVTDGDVEPRLFCIAQLLDHDRAARCELAAAA